MLPMLPTKCWVPASQLATGVFSDAVVAWNRPTCPACDGARYVSRKQIACRVCNARGWVRAGFTGSRKCPSCLGRCYVNREQNHCLLCEGQGTLRGGLLQLYRAKECVACQGAGMIVGDQFPCR